MCGCQGGWVLWKFQLDLKQTNTVPFNGTVVTHVRSTLNNQVTLDELNPCDSVSRSDLAQFS